MHSIQYCKNSSIVLQRFPVTRLVIIWFTVLLHLLETQQKRSDAQSDASFSHTTEYGDERLKSAWVFPVSAWVETIARRRALEREDSHSCMLNAFIKHMHADVQKHTHTSAWPPRLCPVQGRVIWERKQQITHKCSDSDPQPSDNKTHTRPSQVRKLENHFSLV